MRPSALLALASLGLLCGCAQPADAPLSSSFGSAAARMDVQIAHPGRPSLDPPETSAERATLAIRRYEADRVIPPATSSTSAVAAAQGNATPPPPASPSP